MLTVFIALFNMFISEGWFNNKIELLKNNKESSNNQSDHLAILYL